MQGDGKVSITAKGVRWHADRLNELSSGQGVFIIFNTMEKTFEVGVSKDILTTVRASWWRKNFWNFSWFKIESMKNADTLKVKLASMTYEQAWRFNGDEAKSPK